MQIRRLPEFPGRLNSALNFPLFFNPVWLRAIERVARETRAELLIVEDLPLAPAVVTFGAIRRIPVIYDMGEVYPEFLRGLHERVRPSPWNRILRSPEIADLLERVVLRSADHVFVVSEESLDRAVSRGARSSHVTIVGNTPEAAERLRKPTTTPTELEGIGDRPVILFVGILIHDRGLFELVQAMPSVLAKFPEALLVIVGDGPERSRLLAESKKLAISASVVFTGWVQHDDLPAYYQRAQVGMLPFSRGGQIEFTLANKLFDYLGAGLPVAATDVPPMRRIVTESDVGVLISASEPGAIASAVLTILSLSPEARAQLSNNGAELVNDRYNWSIDAARLVRVVDSFQNTLTSWSLTEPVE